MKTSVIKSLKCFLAITFLLHFTISPVYSQTFKCIRVIGGETIVLSTGQKVRLIGVATPETKNAKKPVGYYGKEANAFIKAMIEGKEIRLEYGDQPYRNKSGDLWAYVYLTDGTFLNEEIIKQGYGHTDTSVPFKYSKVFSQYEKEARETKRGMWAKNPPRRAPKYIREQYMGAKDSTIYHLPTCVLIRKVNPLDRRVFSSVKKAVDAGFVPCKVCQPPFYK